MSDWICGPAVRRQSPGIAEYAILAIISCLLTACPGANRDVNDYMVLIDSISKIMVPDKREGICEITLEYANGILVLKGETNIPRAKDSIVTILKKGNTEFIDSITILPDPVKISKQWGIVTVSVCNIRYSHSQAAEMVSQAILGTPARILKEQNGWLLIQTPDRYIGWTEEESLKRITDPEFDAWRASPRIIWLGKTADIYSDKKHGHVVSDLVTGSILQSDDVEEEYIRVSLPDGRMGWLTSKDCKELLSWSLNRRQDEAEIASTAFSFSGYPYLWGGTSPKGMDCSGFVKTVYYLNGLVLARDASLQFRYGLTINDYTSFDSLSVGDLLFFGNKSGKNPRPTHVGIYIGNTEFIHCSGIVRVNSLDSSKGNYSKYRHDTFLGARRITGTRNSEGIAPLSGHSWYFKN